jgi:hypothetical protein
MGKAQTLLSTESIFRPPAPAPFLDDNADEDDDDEDFQTMTQMAKCLMCGESVDPADLTAYGRMNTHKQEKFANLIERQLL